MLLKKISLALIVSALYCSTALAEKNLTSVVKWDAKAVKNSKSSLLANPTSKMLNFSYSEQNESFNKVSSDYDLDVLIPNGVTDTIFTAKIIKNSLSRKIDESKLNVGVAWNGKTLNKDSETLLDGENNENALIFNIESAELEKKHVNIKDLKNGKWDGDVALAFTAYWQNEAQ